MLLASHKVTAFWYKHDHDCSLTSTKETLRPKPQSVRTIKGRPHLQLVNVGVTISVFAFTVSTRLCYQEMQPNLVLFTLNFKLKRFGTVLSDEYDTEARENKTKGKVLTIDPLILTSISCAD